ncbi:hypothetical protein PAGL106935_26205 [Paenibacillus glucanolyticus]
MMQTYKRCIEAPEAEEQRLKQGKSGHTEGIYDLQEAYDGDNLCL